MAQFRLPRIAKPKTMAPDDVLSAVVETEKDAYRAFVKEPAEAMGITPPPEFPTPAAVAQQITGALPEMKHPFLGAQGSPPVRNRLLEETKAAKEKEIEEVVKVTKI